MKEFFLFLFFLIKICYIKTIFDITISDNPHYNVDNIIITKGKYNTLYANVYIDEEKLKKEDYLINTSTTIFLDNNIKDFKILNNSFIIDITEGNIFQFEFGISCNSNRTLNETHTIQFLSSDTNFIIHKFNITIIEKNEINLKTINNFLYIELEKIKNVDDLNLNFKLDDTINESVTIKSYNDINILLFTFNRTISKITTENTCFIINSNITKNKINSDLETDFKGIFLKNSILSMKIEDSPIINSLKISLDFDLNGILLFCSLTEINKPFLDQSDVIYQKKTKGYYNIYKFQKEFGKLILFFDNLNIYQEYKMICYFKNINKDNSTYESLTFGNFNNSDYKINLRPKYSKNINPINCINFNFSNLTEKEEDIFIHKIIKFCENFFITNQKRIWNKCIKRNVSNTIGNGICVLSTNNNTRNDNYKEKFNNFTSQITKDKFRKLNIPQSIINNYNNYYLENDNEEPKQKSITFLNFRLENNIVKFESMNNDSNIECYILFTNRILENVEPIDFKDSIIITKEKQNFEINIPKEFYKEKINLNLIFQCYNLPNFSYHYLHSSPFIVLQIINNTIKTSNLKLFPNCNDLKNKFLPQCFNKSFNLTLNIDLDKLLLPNYFNYAILINQHKNKDNLFFEIENLKKSFSKFKGKINNEELEEYLFTFSIQLYLTKCSNYIDYEYCFNEKIKIIEEMIQKYNATLIKKYNTTLLYEQKDSKKNLFNTTFLLFYYITINIDSFSYENTIMLIQIIYEFLLKNPELNDYILRLYYYILNNLISSITFSQFQNTNFEIDNNNIIKDNKFPLIPFILKKLCKSNKILKNLALKFDNYNYFQLEKNNSNKKVYYKDDDVNITIPIPKSIQDHSLHYYCIVQYINYPLFNYRKKDEYYNKVYQISFIDEKNDNNIMQNFKINDGIEIEFNDSKKNKFCYFFDYKERLMKKKISNVRFTQNEVITYQNYSKENYLKCLALQFGDITIGKNDINGVIITDIYGKWNIIILIILIILLIFILVIIILQKRKNNNYELIENDEITINSIIKSDLN